MYSIANLSVKQLNKNYSLNFTIENVLISKIL